MPVYKYRAKKDLEDITEGRMEAQTKVEAIDKLSQMGYLPLSIEQETEPVGTVTFSAIRYRGRVKSRGITIFSRQLASLLRSGVPILKSIQIISEQSEDPRLKSILRSVHAAVKDGATFSSVLAQYPNVFSPLYIAMVRTGENSGALPEALLKIADYRSTQEEIFSRFRMALAYPVLMALVGIATVIFMLTFVMPRLIGIFTNIGRELPLPTKILISISQALQQWGIWIALVFAAFILVARLQGKTKAGKISFGLFILHMPIFGSFILKAELARFCRTLELLTKNGVTILKALDIAIPVLENEVLKNRLRQSYKELEQGGSFGKSLKNSALFPLFMSNLIIVGEESGRLEEALAEVAGSYERDTDEAIRVMGSLLEPLMILVMGLIVGFIVISMLLPVFEIHGIAG